MSASPNSPTTSRPSRRLTSCATPESVITSLQDTTITPDTDPTTLCPICLDPFVVNTEAKNLPCNHIYHPHCIVPWLEINTSCPVCRFELSSVESVNVNVEAADSMLEYIRFVRSLTDLERVTRNSQVSESRINGTSSWLDRLNDQEFETWLPTYLERATRNNRVYESRISGMFGWLSRLNYQDLRTWLVDRVYESRIRGTFGWLDRLDYQDFETWLMGSTRPTGLERARRNNHVYDGID